MSTKIADARDTLLPEVCLQRSEAVRLIPDVKRNQALQAFDQVIFEVATRCYEGPVAFTQEDVEGCALRSHFDREMITPKGGRLLKRMFEAGMIEQQRKSSSRDLSGLEAYIASENALREQSARIREERAAAEASREAARAAREAAVQELDARAKHLAQAPQDATAAEITRDLIDRVFIHRNGLGCGGAIELAGMDCRKELDRYVSNSGKTRSTSVTVYWIDGAGVRHGDPDIPRRLNRRSDPRRNWGLGRE